jgi:hypothetical protein
MTEKICVIFMHRICYLGTEMEPGGEDHFLFLSFSMRNRYIMFAIH